MGSFGNNNTSWIPLGSKASENPQLSATEAAIHVIRDTESIKTTQLCNNRDRETKEEWREEGQTNTHSAEEQFHTRMRVKPEQLTTGYRLFYHSNHRKEWQKQNVKLQGKGSTTSFTVMKIYHSRR
ncbi:hypothetical protein PIB30_028103 [Stylosanthes scabra]|uniref:Uncharacterized protein n=1 Tax=Stylosanthes scabra TaxID=79078 RepID=A0ABU6TAK8_9FABA|nr:hypothetical protein [Stylosanthes scabra]